MPNSSPLSPANSPVRARINPFAALKRRDFRFVWSSEMLYQWAHEMENLVLAWFVLSDTGSPLQVGLIGAARFGGILLSPLYGTVVDRFDRRKVQITARAMSVGLASILMTLVLTDQFVTWHAFAIVGVSSLVRTLGIVVTQALSADTVPGETINNAMGLNRATIDLARITGSLSGGWAMSTLGMGTAYVIIVALYFGSTVAAFLLSARAAPVAMMAASGLRGYASEVKEGISYVGNHRLTAGLLFFAFLIEMTTFPIVNELIAPLGAELYGTDENGVGAMRAVASAGALIGALITGAYPSIRNAPRLLLAAVVAWHLLTLPLAIDMPFGAALGALFAWGICGGISFVALMVGLLRSAPPRFRGRIMGLRALAIYGLPLGLLIGGWISEEFGVRAMVWVHGLAGLSMALVAAAVWPELWRSGQSAPESESSR